MAHQSILIVEDDDVIRRATEAALVAGGHRVRSADSCSSGLAMMLEELPALLILDISLPDGTGWDLLDSIRSASPEGQPVVIVVSSSRVTRGELRERRIDKFVAKPFDMGYLEELVRQLLGCAPSLR